MQSTYILSRKIQQLSNTITQRRNRDLKKLDLTADQADALLFFHAHPESAAADLKTHLGVTHQAARACGTHGEQEPAHHPHLSA